ncbi:MAG: hypothetical protein OEZ06_11710 [Myxococcales bacterium]|nr:hypothetical protein [Myxococcales bacterium]
MTTRKPGKAKPPKKIGRPRKREPQRIPHAELDKLLVFGEVVDGEDGSGPVVSYPSYRELARRYGVCHSVIATYARRYDRMRRRGLAEPSGERTSASTRSSPRNARPTSPWARPTPCASSTTTSAASSRHLIENRVRMDNPSDFNLMLRLKEFLDGGADSHSEVQAMFTLEDLQQRHRRMLRDLDRQRAATDAAALDECRRDARVDGDQESATNSPDRGSSDRAQEVTEGFGCSPTPGWSLRKLQVGRIADQHRNPSTARARSSSLGCV